MRKDVQEKQKEKDVMCYTPNNQIVSYNSTLKRVRRKEPVLSRLRKRNASKI